MMISSRSIAREALHSTDHRPWPVPVVPWVMRMQWLDLLFAHWRVDSSSVASTLPSGLELDTFEGEAWLGVVPFRMAHVAPRFFPDVPGVSAFPELNLRTYVRVGDRPGVWFYTLEAASRIAVRAARTLFHLPYHDARMSCQREGEGIHYASERTHRGAGVVRFASNYRPIGEAYRSKPNTLEEWLTERYCLYAAKPNGTILRGEIHHQPWPLQPAEAEITVNDLPTAYGFETGGDLPLLHFARRIDVVAWAPSKVAGSTLRSDE